MGSVFNKARITHEHDFQPSGKDINEKVRLFWKIGTALLQAKETGEDPFSAIGAIIPWNELSQSISEAGRLSRPESFDYLHLLAALEPLIGGKINLSLIRSNWDEILRLASSIKQGIVTASLMVRKIGSYPRQNGLATALGELGKIERTIFMLNWFMDPSLTRRVTAGLNKGEATNTLATAVCFNRLGEIRDYGFEHQRYRASGLNLVTAAIVLWNTVYLDRERSAH
jgi:Tn3 transposase DDE domain